MTARRLAVTIAALTVVLVLGGCARTVSPRSAPSGGVTTSHTSSPSAPVRTPDSGLATIRESALPPAARHTLELLRAGGPFPYRKDGATFLNRERVLPRQPRGYYREYTVPTRGEGDRGPRRIVSGRGGDRYWTSDHYRTFTQILEGR